MVDQAPKTRKELKADAAAAKAAAKSMRPWWRKKRFMLPAGLVVLIVIIAVAAQSGGGGSTATTTDKGVSPLSNNTKNPPAADVTINSCMPDPTTHWYQAKLTVTNHSSKTSDYSINLSLESADGATKYDTMLATVDKLAAGQTSPQDAQSLKDDVPAGAVCKLAQVDRFASAGS